MLETLGHYKILDRIGAGGMGEAYRARDTRLGRTVALKVLSAGWPPIGGAAFPAGGAPPPRCAL